MCDDWSKKDDRIKVIHKANGGLSDARNAGLDVATGEYIEGVDSDDTVSPEITEQLMKAVLENNAEIAICDLVHIFPGEQRDFQTGTEMKVFTAEDALCEMMYQKSFLYTFWGKIYKKSLLDGVRFPVGMLYEAEQRVEIPNDPVNVSDVSDNQTVTDNIKSEISDKKCSDKEGSDKESSDSKKHTVRIGSHGGLRVVMYAAAALAVFCIVVSFVIILQNAWKHSDEVLMHVDKVHAQYTLADVSYLNDDLDDKHR